MSLFDAPKPMLNPVIWQPNEIMRPEVKKAIQDHLEKIYPMSKVSSMTMIGSSVSHQYSDTSDIDVNVGGIKGESYDAWHKIFKQLNDRVTYLPGTRHPMNFMFQEYQDSYDWSISLGAYNMLKDVWEKRPIPYDKIGDPYKKYEREVHFAKLLLTQIESEVALMNEIRQHDPEQYEDTRKRLAILFKSIEDNRKTAYRYGTGTPALQEYNIVYKIVEGSPYGPLMHEMVSYYDKLHDMSTK